MRRDGRRRLYSADPRALAPVQAWAEKCERLWERHLDAIQQRAEARARSRRTDADEHETKDEPT